MAEDRVIAIAGNFRKRKENAEQIEFEDFRNPWTFHNLFNSDDVVVTTWLIKNGLLARERRCERAGCDGLMRLGKRTGRPLGCTLRCNKSRDHEVSILKHSFFERTKLDVRDVMQLMKSYLEVDTLGLTSRCAGISYGGTAVDWGSFIREVMKENFHRNIRGKKLTGVVEIDESIFGRRVKYNRGNPKGLKVWVFGMVERLTNKLILYPVRDRTRETLIPLIERHVEKVATIYSDGFSTYFNLNQLGYRHFTVLHKYAFKKTYRNVETGGLEVITTNQIEGAWKHAKQYFRKMSGTKASQWEGHMAEIMWHSDVKAHVLRPFFDLMKTVYTLDGPPNLTYPTPLFDSWEGFGELSTHDMVHPVVSDVESTDSEVLELEATDDVLAADSSLEAAAMPIPASQPPGNQGMVRRPPSQKARERMDLVVDLLSESSLSDLDDTVVGLPRTSTPVPGGKKRGQEHVCCPKEFEPTTQEGPRRFKVATSTNENPYQGPSNNDMNTCKEILSAAKKLVYNCTERISSIQSLNSFIGSRKDIN